MQERIPRIVHYCWFGRGEKPRKLVKCIESWHRQLSGYRFIEWNEEHIDLNSNLYVKQAYEARKFAFVSDYVRLCALYSHGGIYLDTDVEVIQSLDRFLSHEAFSGFEDNTFLQSATMGAVPGHPWVQELLNNYEERSFVLPDGSYDLTTNTAVISRICERYGLQQNGEYQVLSNGVVLYPRTYFSGYDYINGGNFISNESYTIHHFSQSWLPLHVRMRSSVKKTVSRLVGPKWIARMRSLLSNS